MNCDRIGELLSALADDELPRAAACGLRRHLHSCTRCAAELAALAETRAAVRRLSPTSASLLSAARPASTPSDFWPSVSRRLDAMDAARARQRRPRPPRLRGMAPLGVALLALLLISASFLALRPASIRPDWVVIQCQQSLHPEPGRRAFFTASPSDASVWLSRQLRQPVPPIDLELAGLELRGALYWRAHGQAIGLLRYERGKERWSLLVLPGAGKLTGSRTITVSRQPFETSAVDGAMLAAWHAHGDLFVLVGTAPGWEVLRVALQAARTCEIER